MAELSMAWRVGVVRLSWMEYRGKNFTIVQGIGPDSWKWTVRLDEKTVKSGEATSRSTAKTWVVCLIDKALAPKKVKLVPPAD
jgi:hypothetical protein